jgi:hypothetical protein
MTYSATSEAFDEGTKVRITITPDASINTADLLGYEIFRDNKQIAFIDSTTTTYEDVVGAINNKALTYEVRAIDALGKVVNSSNNSGKVSAGQIRIERDNVIAASEYTIAWENTDIALNSMLTTDSALNVASNATGSGAIVITFNKETAVTGLRIRPLNGSTLPQGDFTIQVVNQEKTKLAKQSDFANNAATDTTKFITYFTKPGADATDTRIWTYDAKVLRITGSDIDENFLTQFEVAPLADPGDNVALSDYKVGILKETYTYDGGSIAAGTLIVVGSYRGDPIYNTIHVEGKYAETSGLSDTTTYIERPINGEVLMFAEVPQDGETSDISDGLFIFIPDIQREQELQGDCDAVSALPVEMMAKMYRYDTPDQTGTPRVTSTTTWYATPTYDTMPDIIFNQDNTIQ